MSEIEWNVLVGREVLRVDMETFLDISRGRYITTRVARDDVGEFTVSTVLLPFDIDGRHFETMVFRDGESVGCERCATLDEAEQLHASALDAVRAERST